MNTNSCDAYRDEIHLNTCSNTYSPLPSTPTYP